MSRLRQIATALPALFLDAALIIVGWVMIDYFHAAVAAWLKPIAIGFSALLAVRFISARRD